MPYRPASVPTYRLHKRSGQAVGTLSGRDHYLGEHNSPESCAKYRRLIREYVNADFRMPLAPEAEPYTVAKLCDEYLSHAEAFYRNPDRSPTRTVENVKLALRALFEFAADVDANEFGPKLFANFRDHLASSGLARATANDRIKIVRRAFKWAVEQERVAPSVLHGLSAVSGLRRGRSPARETEPVRPAPEADIAAALPHMPPPVRAMVELQLLSGARPGEIVLLRARDIDRTGRVWIFRPAQHKNSWRGQEREIYLGPKAQEILCQWLRPGFQDGHVFSPREAERMRREQARTERRTPLWPSHLRAQERRRATRPRRELADAYDVDTYRQAIERACDRASVARWSPNRLRHNAATRLRQEWGLEVAKAVLGHRLVETTQIYAEADRKRAMDAIERVG